MSTTSISIRGTRTHPGLILDELSLHFLEVLTALVFIALLVLIIVYPLNINHDAALFLDTGRLILGGKTPYVDFDEINFPLIMYMQAIPVGIAQLLGVNPIPVFSLLVMALAAGSAWAIRGILKRHYKDNVPFALQLIPLFVAVYTLYLFLIDQYGQREHLFMLLFLPGLMLRYVRWQGGTTNWRFALLIGLMAGVGAAIKPYFLPIALAPELYWVAEAAFKRNVTRIRHTLFAPEVLALVGFGAVYGLALFLIPVMHNALFNVILPYATTSYSSYGVGVTSLSLLWRFDTMLMWIGLLVALPAVIQNRPLARPLWVLTFTAILVFCWQGKGWYYHRIPALIGLGLLLTITLFQRIELRRRVRLLDPALKVLALLLGVYVLRLGGVIQMHDHYVALRAAIQQHSQPGDPVMIINSSVDPAYPLLVQTGRRSSDPNLSGFPIGVNSASDPDLAAYLASLAHSIQQRQPPMILSDNEATCYGCSTGYDMLQYLQTTGYVSHNITPEYTDSGAVGQFEMYLRK